MPPDRIIQGAAEHPRRFQPDVIQLRCLTVPPLLPQYRGLVTWGPSAHLVFTLIERPADFAKAFFNGR